MTSLRFEHWECHWGNKLEPREFPLMGSQEVRFMLNFRVIHCERHLV